MTERFNEISENFEFLDEWEDRYRYVIELGKSLPAMDPALQLPATKVDGCASQVWIAPEVEGVGEDAVITFIGASDAMIVQGLIAILHAAYNGQTARAVLDTDIESMLSGLGLDQHLSSQRSNGLRAMVTRIRDIATRAAAA